MSQIFPGKLWVFIFWLILTSISLEVRPLFPIDETRYVAVAWEMWVRNDFLVPYLNGETYSHKPPLLFWLMQLSWWIFGVNEYSARLIGPLFTLATLAIVGRIAHLLWPDREQAGIQTQFILLGLFVWMLYGSLTMFDMMLTFFAVLGIYSLLKLTTVSHKSWGCWVLLFGIAIGGGILAKGPVILLHLLPVALLAPLWTKTQTVSFRWLHWYLAILFSVCLGLVIALCWAIPAGINGGEAYRNAIFLGQTSGRLIKSFAHRLPWWWYLQSLPLLLLPWILWQPVWKGLMRYNLKDTGIRFCMAWLLPTFFAFSLISGKRIHYLLPLIPALSLLLFRAVDAGEEESQRNRPIIIASVFLLLGIILLVLPNLNEIYHWRKELSSIAPVWGGLLLVSAASLLFTAIKTDYETVFLICLNSIAAFLILQSSFFSMMGKRYDMTAPAQKIAGLMAEGNKVVIYGGKYHGEYNFAGRIKQSITTIKNRQSVLAWSKQHPRAYVIFKINEDLKYIYRKDCLFPVKSKFLVFLSTKEILNNPELLS